MKYFFITGTSRGLGKALAELLLEKGHVVYGIARGNKISHKNYHHLSKDLSDPASANEIDFGIISNDEAEEVFLINNAGMLGEITHLGNQSYENIHKAFCVNITAPAILMNNFINAFKEKPFKKVIINISSGAGKHAIDGWSTYCSSKAAIDMMSRVVKEEQDIEQTPDMHIYSVAPGIVDTKMQDEIRTADKADFSNIERFKEYKKEGELADPKLVADKFFRNFMEHQPENSEVIQTIRDYV